MSFKISIGFLYGFFQTAIIGKLNKFSSHIKLNLFFEQREVLKRITLIIDTLLFLLIIDHWSWLSRGWLQSSYESAETDEAVRYLNFFSFNFKIDIFVEPVKCYETILLVRDGTVPRFFVRISLISRDNHAGLSRDFLSRSRSSRGLLSPFRSHIQHTHTTFIRKHNNTHPTLLRGTKRD